MIIDTERILILLLVVIALVGLNAHRFTIPYTVLLVLIGLGLTIFQDHLRIEITPELILDIFVPPLVFEAAFLIPLPLLRQNLTLIIALAVPGVVLATLVVGGIVAASGTLPLTTALVFGALLSATDPVAVVALFRKANVAQRLAVIVESESLLNDGTAIIVFGIALLMASTGQFDLGSGLVEFLKVSVGGLIIGGLLGAGVVFLLSRTDDYLVETTLTTCLAFGAYLVAEQFHVSGVLAVVMAGLLSGNRGLQHISPTGKTMIFSFWEYLAFIANSLVFLLIGLTINISALFNSLGPVLVAIVAVLVSRAVSVYALSWLIHRADPTWVFSWQHVLFWGGLRGAISLALVLSLPATFMDRDTVRVMTFGVVLFTLVVQGTTMQFLLKRLGLVHDSTSSNSRA